MQPASSIYQENDSFLFFFLTFVVVVESIVVECEPFLRWELC